MNETVSPVVPLFLCALAAALCLACGMYVQRRIDAARAARRPRLLAVLLAVEQDDEQDDEQATYAAWHALRSHPDTNLQRGVIVDKPEQAI